ncbi:hypothetical protein DPEC_G00276300 [Dallia pectoralis]|uniref:Uncharacterized protein n=1 Tax=Dallia pectoralis TaxID=75939 RepID=A0ACC2FLF6_DALPE|nr:hypothetical protein DPEC_G00276300 [Dallia pectoralis]
MCVCHLRPLGGAIFSETSGDRGISPFLSSCQIGSDTFPAGIHSSSGLPLKLGGVGSRWSNGEVRMRPLGEITDNETSPSPSYYSAENHTDGSGPRG